MSLLLASPAVAVGVRPGVAAGAARPRAARSVVLCSTQGPDGRPEVATRRPVALAAVVSLGAAAAAAATLVGGPRDAMAGIDLSDLPFSTAEDPDGLPKGFRKQTLKLATALREPLAAEANGAGEQEIRKKADPVKSLVKEYLGRWQGDPAVRDNESYSLVTGALRDIGTFYQKNGARAKMPADVRNAIIAKLDAVDKELL